MDDKSYIGFMALHSHIIVDLVAQKLGISKRQALELYYGSSFYSLYERENTKLWHFSNITLADLLFQEIHTGRIEMPVEG